MSVKLLLVEDVDDLGRSGDIVSVKPGYARNYLLPQKLAFVADKKALQMQAKLQEERRKKAIIERQESEQIAAKIDGLTLTQIVKVDQEGHMYGSVSALDVVHLIQEQIGVTLEKRAVPLKHAIKETGAFTLQLKLKEGVPATIKLKVISEAGLAAEAEAASQASSSENVETSESEEPKKKKGAGRKKKETVEKEDSDA